jgi:hypothetical protein
LLSTAYVTAELLPGWVRAAATVNPYGTWSTLCGPPGNEGRWTTWARWPETTSGGRISSSTARGE